MITRKRRKPSNQHKPLVPAWYVTEPLDGVGFELPQITTLCQQAICDKSDSHILQATNS